MINKSKFSVKNTKKVLHKVGKKWVIMSAVLLGLVVGGMALTSTQHVTLLSSLTTEVHADTPVLVNPQIHPMYNLKLEWLILGINL